LQFAATTVKTLPHTAEGKKESGVADAARWMRDL